LTSPDSAGVGRELSQRGRSALAIFVLFWLLTSALIPATGTTAPSNPGSHTLTLQGNGTGFGTISSVMSTGITTTGPTVVPEPSRYAGAALALLVLALHGARHKRTRSSLRHR